jgi:hypothetical protein
MIVVIQRLEMPVTSIGLHNNQTGASTLLFLLLTPSWGVLNCLLSTVQQHLIVNKPPPQNNTATAGALNGDNEDDDMHVIGLVGSVGALSFLAGLVLVLLSVCLANLQDETRASGWTRDTLVQILTRGKQQALLQRNESFETSNETTTDGLPWSHSEYELKVYREWTPITLLTVRQAMVQYLTQAYVDDDADDDKQQDTDGDSIKNKDGGGTETTKDETSDQEYNASITRLWPKLWLNKQRNWKVCETKWHKRWLTIATSVWHHCRLHTRCFVLLLPFWIASHPIIIIIVVIRQGRIGSLSNSGGKYTDRTRYLGRRNDTTKPQVATRDTQIARSRQGDGIISFNSTAAHVDDSSKRGMAGEKEALQQRVAALELPSSSGGVEVGALLNEQRQQWEQEQDVAIQSLQQ